MPCPEGAGLVTFRGVDIDGKRGKFLPTVQTRGGLAGLVRPAVIWPAPGRGTLAASRFSARCGDGAARQHLLDGGLGLGKDPGAQ